jgi:hypothetical protein
VGYLPGCATILTLEADDDDLYKCTIFTRGVPERIGETQLRRYIDDRDNKKGYGCIGYY